MNIILMLRLKFMNINGRVHVHHVVTTRVFMHTSRYVHVRCVLFRKLVRMFMCSYDSRTSHLFCSPLSKIIEKTSPSRNACEMRQGG